MTIVLLIQIVAAALLLLGSGLIFWALAEIDAPVQARPLVHPRLDRPAPDARRVRSRGRDRDRLPRAA
jgi:hypothetical protein